MFVKTKLTIEVMSGTNLEYFYLCNTIEVPTEDIVNLPRDHNGNIEVYTCSHFF